MRLPRQLAASPFGGCERCLWGTSSLPLPPLPPPPDDLPPRTLPFSPPSLLPLRALAIDKSGRGAGRRVLRIEFQAVQSTVTIRIIPKGDILSGTAQPRVPPPAGLQQPSPRVAAGQQPSARATDTQHPRVRSSPAPVLRPGGSRAPACAAATQHPRVRVRSSPAPCCGQAAAERPCHRHPAPAGPQQPSPRPAAGRQPSASPGCAAATQIQKHPPVRSSPAPSCGRAAAERPCRRRPAPA